MLPGPEDYLFMKDKKNIAGVLAFAALCVVSTTGCNNNSTMSAQDAKNFKGGGTMTAEDRKKMAAGIDDFYKTHPQYKQPGAGQPVAAPPAAQ